MTVTSDTGSLGRAASRRWLVLVLVCLAQFMTALDVTVVNVALPSMQKDLHLGGTSLAWVINAYVLAFGGFLLLGGRAGDLLGRKRLFLAGVSLFTVASLFCGLAQSVGMLLAFRATQGLGAAMVSPAVVSIITTTFTETGERAKALAIWSGSNGAAAAFGLILGGILTEQLSWPWIFYVNLPIGVATVAAAAVFVPESRADAADRGFDIAGALLVTAGLSVLVYAIVEAQSRGWGSATTLGFGGVAIVLLAGFIAVERVHPRPLLRLGIFASRTLAIGNVVIALLVGVTNTVFFLMTLYLQEVQHDSPIRTGLAFLALPVGLISGSVLAERLVPRIGIRPQIAIGLAISIIGFVLYLRVPAGHANYALDLFPPMFLGAFGLGNALVPATLLATTNVALSDAGLAAGLLNTFFQVGGALGLAILSTLAASRTNHRLDLLGHAPSAHEYASAFTSGFDLAFLVGIAFFAVAGGLIISLLRKRHLGEVDTSPAAAVDALETSLIADTL